MNIKPYPIARSLARPFIPERLLYRAGSGGTCSSAYCYSVWLRHLKNLHVLGLIEDWNKFKTVAEIGPGDSLGIGIAALYSGFRQYYGFDVIKHATAEKNIEVSNEIAAMFSEQRSIPSGEGFEKVLPVVDCYDFPKKAVNWSRQPIATLATQISDSLAGKTVRDMSLEYVVPWGAEVARLSGSVDLIFSQAVLEHVENLGTAYENMFEYLRPGGIMSHQIDFKTHEMTKSWNGHWFLGPGTWRFLHASRKYPMNRLPLSAHLSLLDSVGFELIAVKEVHMENQHQGMNPVVPGVEFSDDDLITSGAYVVCRKP